MYMCMFMCMHKHMHMYMCRWNLRTSKSRHARTAVPLYMSRRQRSAPKANISPSVRLGLTSIVAGNEAGIRTMLSAAASDDLVEKLVELHVERGLPSE